MSDVSPRVGQWGRGFVSVPRKNQFLLISVLCKSSVPDIADSAWVTLEYG